MNSFLKVNKNLLTYSLVIMIIISFFGINFLISFLGNILLLLLLMPLVFILLVSIGFNSYSSKIINCSNCGEISFGFREKCKNCGADLGDIGKKNKFNKEPSKSIIEVKAEEIK